MTDISQTEVGRMLSSKTVMVTMKKSVAGWDPGRQRGGHGQARSPSRPQPPLVSSKAQQGWRRGRLNGLNQQARSSCLAFGYPFRKPVPGGRGYDSAPAPSTLRPAEHGGSTVKPASGYAHSCAKPRARGKRARPGPGGIYRRGLAFPFVFRQMPARTACSGG
jgi:hypothetical protein